MNNYLSNKNAQALIISLIGVLILTILGAAFLSKSIHENRMLQRQKLEKELLYLAEGAVEDAIAQFKYDIANFNVDHDVAQYPLTDTIITNFSPSTAFPGGASASSLITEAEDDERTITDSDGIQVRVKNYRLTVDVQHPVDSNFSLTLNQVITRRLIYTFQHAVFYEDDLELLPGVNMTFSGRVHSNNDIYLGANNTLTIDSEYLRSSGNIYNRRKDDGSSTSGDVDIKRAGTSDFYEMDGLDSDSAGWATESQTRWNGTVQTSVHGVTELTAPSVGSIQPGGYYDNNCGMRILNGTITKGGVTLVEGTDIPPGTISTSTTCYNNRESEWVRMTEVDMQKLGGGNFGGTDYPNHLADANFNGLIYATRDDAVTNQPGIRLLNGSEIKRTDGLTVVTNDPLYIQGDYNTVNKKSAAVICDAANVLSNNWDDSHSNQNLPNRTATNTTVNTAFIAGIDTTTTGHYNGGLENYPRLHERWSGRELEIRGSFVALWDSQIATGAWVYGNPQYEAPIRNWDYDSDFLSVGMPVFTPWAVEVSKGAWWKE